MLPRSRGTPYPPTLGSNVDVGFTHARDEHRDMAEWHTELEKELIEDFGGTPTESFGADGSINNDPVEVRLAKKEDRFRLNRDTHQQLVEQDGTYIFDDVTDNQPPEQVTAEAVDEQLSNDWHSDRGYEHQFVPVDSMF